jgi:hypothetical protein
MLNPAPKACARRVAAWLTGFPAASDLDPLGALRADKRLEGTHKLRAATGEVNVPGRPVNGDEEGLHCSPSCRAGTRRLFRSPA